MAAISPQALAVIGEPDGRVVVLGAGEEEVAIPIVFEESQWPLMAFHQDWAHFRLSSRLEVVRRRERVMVSVVWREANSRRYRIA